MRRLPGALLVALLVGCNGGGGGPASPPPPASLPPPAAPAVAAAGVPLVTAVYTADNDLDGVRQLYALDTAGGVLNLSHGAGAGHHVTSFALSPDQRLVAFAVEGSGLYVTPVHESTAVLLSPPGVVTVDEIAWTPDGSRIVYRGAASPAQLYLVRPDGSGEVDVTGGAGEVRGGVQWSPDGAWLKFHWDGAVAEHYELYVVRPDGSDLRQLSRSASAPGTFRLMSSSWSPAGSCVAFRSDLAAAGEFELWVADVDAATPPVRVSTETGTTGAVDQNGWQWSRDGSALVYTRRDAAADRRALYMVSKGGGDARKVSGDAVGSVAVYAWSPDGARVAFRDGESLHVTDGTAALELARANRIGGFAWSPAGDRLAYLAGDLVPDELWVVDAQGGGPVIVGEEVTGFVWRPAPALAQANGGDELSFGTNAPTPDLDRATTRTWDGTDTRLDSVLPEHTRRTDLGFADRRFWHVAKVFIGATHFVHHLYVTTPDGATSRNVACGIDAEITPLHEPVAAHGFDGFFQVLDADLAGPGGAVAVIWYAHGDAQAQSASIVEWNPIFRGQIAPNLYLSIEALHLGRGNTAFDLKFNEVGFQALAELTFAPALVAVSVLHRIRQWVASGAIDPGDGTPVRTVSTDPPRYGFAHRAQLHTGPDLATEGPLLDSPFVQVLLDVGDALLVSDGWETGWIHRDEVAPDPCPAAIRRNTHGTTTLPGSGLALIEAGTPVAVVDEQDFQGTRFFQVFWDGNLEWVPAEDVVLKPLRTRTIEQTAFFGTPTFSDPLGSLARGQVVTVLDMVTNPEGGLATLVSWDDGEGVQTAWVDDFTLE